MRARAPLASPRRLAGTVFVAVLLAARGGFAGEVHLERIATGLERPVFATAPPGDDPRLFLVEQHTGRIKILALRTR